MKTLQVVTAPMCNFCNSKPALYDAPTVTGQWAYACEECSIGKMDPSGVGTKFEIRKISKKKATGDVQPGIEPKEDDTKYWTRAIRDSIRIVKCPTCSMKRKLEIDADGEFKCEACGQLVSIPTSLF
jgi:ribosomal protein S27E